MAKKQKQEAQAKKVESAGEIQTWPIGKVKPYKRNAKLHPPEQVKALASIIKEVGFDVPIVVDRKGTVIKGHGRLLAAKELGMTEVPVIVRDLDPAAATAARLGDNRLAETGWDFDALVADVVEGMSLGLDPILAGFTLKELGLDGTGALPSEEPVTSLQDDGDQQEAAEEGSEGIDLGEGEHTCPRCGFNFGDDKRPLDDE